MTDSLLNVYFVCDGVERTEQISSRVGASEAETFGGLFDNRLSRESLERIGRIVEIADGLDKPHTTDALIRMARAEQDAKGALGALRMLDVSGVVHARPAGGRQLEWVPGRRPRGRRIGRAEGLWAAVQAREGLRHAAGTWVSTDLIVRSCGYDEAMPEGLVELDRRPGVWRRLPTAMFADTSKHGRRQALGGLKTLYWLGQVAFRYYSSQAVEWRWIGEDGLSRDVFVAFADRHPPLREADDPYLSGKEPRSDARWGKARAHHELFHKHYQAWIDRNHPAKARAWRERQDVTRGTQHKKKDTN